MFLHLLNQAQKQCFCNVVRFIVTADGVVDEKEKRLLAMAQRELALDELPPRITSLALLATQLNVFDSPLARNILLIESVAAAMADGDIPKSEMEVLEGICDCLKMPREKISECTGFAKKFHDLIQEGEKLVFTEQ